MIMLTGLHFSDQSGKSYYCNSINKFLKDKPDEILGNLTKYGAKYGFDSTTEQIDAWEEQIESLQEKLFQSGISGDIIFEYDIVRLGKRIDVVLLIKHMVFSLEFKNGAKTYRARDAEQAEDYALDIKNFHKESENLYVCPILVATEAEDRENIVDSYSDGQVRLQYANKRTLMDCIKDVYDKYGTDDTIDFEKWYNSPYCPTPTIIDAAVTAYRENTVKEIANSEAGQEDIDSCERKVNEIIEKTKLNRGKSIIFITGVPGAGKTIVGLDMASKHLNVKEDTKTVYLSGNGPLVQVLRKALIDNSIERIKEKNNGKISKEERKLTESAVSSFIQEAYRFRKDYINHFDHEPENIIIFDEAQRCWNKDKLTDWSQKKMGINVNASEPEYFISIMDRRKDWAVIICLVGLGQDIYDGEVGINEWFRSALEDYDDWDVFYSSKIFDQMEDVISTKDLLLHSSRSHIEDSLHLNTSIRSFRSEKLSDFVDNLLSNKPNEAKKVYELIKKTYPIYITRDINKAKDYVRNKVRGSQRSGVIACSSAQRLKPEGIFVPTNIDVEHWFLAPKEDLRSSNFLEVVASEFKVQGLEIDYSVVCWDADLRRKKDNDWDYYNFKGTKWQKRNRSDQQRYLLNAYRVLLTRARQSMVIFVPYGVDKSIDSTRDSSFYNDIYDYLHNKCGIDELK